MVNGVKSKKSKFPATLFQALTLLEIDIYYRQNRELQRLKEASCFFHYHTIPFHVPKSTIAFFLSEVVYLTLREEESNPSLFAFLFHAFQWLDIKDEGYANFHLWFMLHYARYLGISPVAPDNSNSPLISYDLQVFGGLTDEAQGALKLLISCPQGPPDTLQMNNYQRAQLLDRLIRFYAHHVDGFSGLKSYPVLQEIFR